MPTTIRLKPELENRYKNLARKTGRSQSFYMQKALEEEIDKLEWEFEILDIAEKCRSGEMETYTLDEVIERHGLHN